MLGLYCGDVSWAKNSYKGRTLMLRSRLPVSAPVRYWPNRSASSLRLSISLSKISPTPVLAHRVLLRRALAATDFPTVYPIPRRATPPSSATLHPTPRLLHRRTALHHTRSSSLHVVPRPLRAPRCCWGATDATVIHQKIAAATMRDLNKKILR